MFKQLTKIDTLRKLSVNCLILKNNLYSPEDRKHRETQSCELCSISFSFQVNLQIYYIYYIYITYIRLL